MTPFDWTPPDTWSRTTTIDAHPEGKPFRVVTGPASTALPVLEVTCS